MKSTQDTLPRHLWIEFNIRYLFYALTHKLSSGRNLKKSGLANIQKKTEHHLAKKPYVSHSPRIVKRITNTDHFISLNKFRDLKEPIVIEGGCKHWPAIKKWDFDFLKREHGNIILSGSNSTREDPVRITRSLKEGLEKLQGNKPVYTNFEPIVELAPQLKHDLKFEELAHLIQKDPRSRFFTVTFLGPKNYISALHMDIVNIFLNNLWGKREFYLYSHDQTPLFYLTPEVPTHGYTYFSEIPSASIFETTNIPAFPLFKYAQPFKTILQPGDILYIPAFTWHIARYHEDSIGVATGFRDLFKHYAKSPIFTLLAIKKYLDTFSIH